MITRELVRIHAVDSPAIFSRPMDRAEAKRWLAGVKNGQVGYELRNVPTCECCGEVATSWFNRDAPRAGRCRKHYRRNPCIVEGCGRSFKIDDDGHHANDQTICGQHWRQFVPVGSPERRVYLRFFRRARRFGWTDGSIRAFERFWDALVKRVRAKSRGDVDMAEVTRMFGWDKAA